MAMACSTFFTSQVIEDNWSECHNPGSYGYTWLYPNGVATIVSLLWLASNGTDIFATGYGGDLRPSVNE